MAEFLAAVDAAARNLGILFYSIHAEGPDGGKGSHVARRPR